MSRLSFGLLVHEGLCEDSRSTARPHDVRRDGERRAREADEHLAAPVGAHGRAGLKPAAATVTTRRHAASDVDAGKPRNRCSSSSGPRSRPPSPSRTATRRLDDQQDVAKRSGPSPPGVAPVDVEPPAPPFRASRTVRRVQQALWRQVRSSASPGAPVNRRVVRRRGGPVERLSSHQAPHVRGARSWSRLRASSSTRRAVSQRPYRRGREAVQIFDPGSACWRRTITARRAAVHASAHPGARAAERRSFISARARRRSCPRCARRAAT